MNMQFAYGTLSDVNVLFVHTNMSKGEGDKPGITRVMWSKRNIQYGVAGHIWGVGES